jgi:hypothetical protein
MTTDPEHLITYAPLDNVVAFDATGAGPYSARISVTANVHPSDNYPECRIAVHIGRLASHALTIEQSAMLRARLLEAENDVRAGTCRPARWSLTATGDEGRCESCSVPIQRGEPIVIEDAATDDRVVLHAGPCPSERND